jgi:hypothetical protein
MRQFRKTQREEAAENRRYRRIVSDLCATMRHAEDCGVNVDVDSRGRKDDEILETLAVVYLAEAKTAQQIREKNQHEQKCKAKRSNGSSGYESTQSPKRLSKEAVALPRIHQACV